MAGDQPEYLTVSYERVRPLHVGAFVWDGFVYPELYVREDATPGVRLAGRLLLACGALALVPYYWLQRAWLRRHADLAGAERELLLDGIGPAAFLQTTAERLRGRRAPRQTLEQFVAGAGANRVFVIDDFYADPQAVRALALRTPMEYYEKAWFKTRGDVAALKEQARERLAEATGLAIDRETFHADFDGLMEAWNGALNVKLSENLFALNACSIHNHANLGADAWSVVVYLDSGGSGTTFWSRRGRPDTWLVPERVFDSRVSEYEPLAEVEARFNRAVVFPAHALHRGEAGYGHDHASGRLFQTFFFAAAP